MREYFFGSKPRNRHDSDCFDIFGAFPADILYEYFLSRCAKYFNSELLAVLSPLTMSYFMILFCDFSCPHISRCEQKSYRNEDHWSRYFRPCRSHGVDFIMCCQALYACCCSGTGSRTIAIHANNHAENPIWRNRLSTPDFGCVC